MYWRALPEGWTELSYDEFLAERRRRMALVVRDAMGRLADADYEAALPPAARLAEEASVPAASSLRQLVNADLLPAGTMLIARGTTHPHAAQVLPDGRLYADGETYDSLIELSESLELDGNPWTAWTAELADGRVVLSLLRDAYDDHDDAAA